MHSPRISTACSCNHSLPWSLEHGHQDKKEFVLPAVVYKFRPQSCVSWETCVSKECGRYALQELLRSLFKELLPICSLISDTRVILRPTTGIMFIQLQGHPQAATNVRQQEALQPLHSCCLKSTHLQEGVTTANTTHRAPTMSQVLFYCFVCIKIFNFPVRKEPLLSPFHR